MRAKTAPKSAAQKFRIGDPVWVLRPRPMRTHRSKTWFTPLASVCRIGCYTYCMKVGPRHFRARHESQIRDREPDVRGKNVSLDYIAHQANSGDDYAEQDNYTVAEILAHLPSASAPEGVEFKVRC